MPDDLFAAANESAGGSRDYDPSKFYTRSRNKLGHGVTVRLTLLMPPDVVGAVSSLIARRVFPEYKTPADLYRDAIVHVLNWRAQQADDSNFTPAVNAWTAMQESEELMSQSEVYRQAISNYQKALFTCQYDFERDKIKESIARNLDSFPEPYRTQLAQLTR